VNKFVARAEQVAGFEAVGVQICRDASPVEADVSVLGGFLIAFLFVLEIGGPVNQ
jgi:hypothetical protein